MALALPGPSVLEPDLDNSFLQIDRAGDMFQLFSAWVTINLDKRLQAINVEVNYQLPRYFNLSTNKSIQTAADFMFSDKDFKKWLCILKQKKLPLLRLYC